MKREKSTSDEKDSKKKGNKQGKQEKKAVTKTKHREERKARTVGSIRKARVDAAKEAAGKLTDTEAICPNQFTRITISGMNDCPNKQFLKSYCM